VDLWKPERDPGALILSDAGFASGSGTVREAIYAFGVEAVETLSDGLGMAAELFGYPGGPKSLPAQRDDAGAQDPVSGSVAATGQLTDLRPFRRVFGRAGAQKLWHVLFSFSGRRFGHELMCTAFEERSTNGSLLLLDIEVETLSAEVKS